jgi:hypothetical protein
VTILTPAVDTPFIRRLGAELAALGYSTAVEALALDELYLYEEMSDAPPRGRGPGPGAAVVLVLPENGRAAVWLSAARPLRLETDEEGSDADLLVRLVETLRASRLRLPAPPPGPLRYRGWRHQ